MVNREDGESLQKHMTCISIYIYVNGKGVCLEPVPPATPSSTKAGFGCNVALVPSQCPGKGPEQVKGRGCRGPEPGTGACLVGKERSAGFFPTA